MDLQRLQRGQPCVDLPGVEQAGILLQDQFVLAAAVMLGHLHLQQAVVVVGEAGGNAFFGLG